jgi:flagellar motility protein MotE (MotC chaperone)
MSLQTKKELTKALLYLIEKVEALQSDLRGMQENNENPKVISVFTQLDFDETARQIGKFNESINKTIQQLYESK